MSDILQGWADAYWQSLFNKLSIAFHNWLLWIDSITYDIFLIIATILLLAYFLSNMQKLKQYFVLTIFAFSILKLILGVFI